MVGDSTNDPKELAVRWFGYGRDGVTRTGSLEWSPEEQMTTLPTKRGNTLEEKI
ncbi:MAG: hypothetical protein ACYCVG_11265 [Leptospirillum sp.]|jgi:hypothetical protein